jgi:hypothetical protein
MESGSPCGENRMIFTRREINSKVRPLKHSRLPDSLQIDRKRFPETILFDGVTGNTDCSL